MARTVEIPVKLELASAIVVKPGDKLVLGYANQLAPNEAAAIRRRVAEQLPGVEAVIIVGATQLVAYRPDDDGTKPEMSDAEFERRLRKWIRVNPTEFEAWLAKRQRIRGDPPIGAR